MLLTIGYFLSHDKGLQVFHQFYQVNVESYPPLECVFYQLQTFTTYTVVTPLRKLIWKVRKWWLKIAENHFTVKKKVWFCAKCYIYLPTNFFELVQLKEPFCMDSSRLEN